MKRKQKNTGRRGMTIAEMAISMAIILIVSAATISLQISAIRQESKNSQLSAVIQYGDEVLDCFQWAQNQTEFRDAVEVLGFVETEPNSGVYTLGRGNMLITVTINTQEATMKMTVKAVNADDETIYEFTYEK